MSTLPLSEGLVTHYINVPGLVLPPHITAYLTVAILKNAVMSQHGALLSDDIKALKTNR